MKPWVVILLESAIAAAIIVACILMPGLWSLEESSFYAGYRLLINSPPTTYGNADLPAVLMDVAISFILAIIIVGIWQMIKKKASMPEWIVLILLIFLALGTRMVYIHDGIFHHDTIGLATTVEMMQEDGKLHGVISGRYGFVLTTMAYYYSIRNLTGITDMDFTLNMITVLFASLSVLYAYLIARHFLSKGSAILATILFMFMPVVWSVGTFAKEHGVSLFFSLMGVYTFLRGSDKRSAFLLFLGGICLALSMHVRITNVFILIPLIFYILFEPSIRKERKMRGGTQSWKRYVPFLIPIFLVIMELVLLQWGDITYESEYNQILWQFPEIIFRRLYASLFYNLRSITLVGGILLVAGIVTLFRKKKHFLATFFLLWIMPTYLYIGSTPYPSPRHFEVLLLPSIIVLSVALQTIGERSPFQQGIFTTMILSIMILSIIPILHVRHSYSGPMEYALYLNTLEPGPALVISLDDHVYIEHYTNKHTVGIPYKSGSDKVAASLMVIKQELLNGSRVFIDEKTLHWIGQDIIYPNLNTNFELEKVGSVVVEDYHSAEIAMFQFIDKIYEVKLKNGTEEFQVFAYTE